MPITEDTEGERIGKQALLEVKKTSSKPCGFGEGCRSEMAASSDLIADRSAVPESQGENGRG